MLLECNPYGIGANDNENLKEQFLTATLLVSLEGNKNRISVSVNSASLGNQGSANLEVYSGASCVGTPIFSENRIVASTSKTFILPEIGTYSVKASGGTASACSNPAIVLSESKRSSACTVNFTTVDCL
ncbi:hypothetical protein LEP1GSC193_1295 [Leptospira alstonii serovar Pingchang str. 80-412]|uniref:Lipoprotein n=3 Tax=Leptospira alstonii TaxID=28452 RepID=M6CJD7_9LEPT|nr:hypothetical protein LEP1GSC194_0012 [Leptospira alstonii serovar Sichuan str. 79601]EQA78540.1 hypothetical protein LEP1GSC193_1295 [Leptospira alstonii serovar Pingchang str. 80-412]